MTQKRFQFLLDYKLVNVQAWLGAYRISPRPFIYRTRAPPSCRIVNSHLYRLAAYTLTYTYRRSYREGVLDSYCACLGALAIDRTQFDADSHFAAQCRKCSLQCLPIKRSDEDCTTIDYVEPVT